MTYPFIERSTVAENLKRAIHRSGMTAKRVAELAEVRQSHLSRFLKTGAGVDPSKMQRVAQVLDIDIREIYSSAA